MNLENVESLSFNEQIVIEGSFIAFELYGVVGLMNHIGSVRHSNPELISYEMLLALRWNLEQNASLRSVLRIYYDEIGMAVSFVKRLIDAVRPR